MKSFWSKIIINHVLRHKKSNWGREKDFSKFEIASGFVELKLSLKALFRDILLIALAIISAAFGLESFLLPNNFIDGGATGIALLISEVTHISLSMLLIAVNIPFIILAYNLLGKTSAIKAAIAITGLAIVIATIQFPQVTHDNTLVSVFGGFFLGMGIGLAVRGGAVLDGTEILAIRLSKKFSTTIGDIIIIVNILVFSIAALFLSIDTVLYSMVTSLTASKTLEFVIEGIEEYTGVTIVSVHSDEIRTAIIEKVGRGVTVYKGKRGYGVHGPTNDVDIIFTVITRLEISKLTTEIAKIDTDAFVVMNSIKDTKGGMIIVQ
ncbi:MAG: YitT family protein [Bacteroidetes bacterium]|nr:YitT family protein [Bacteroidota bacterium]